MYTHSVYHREYSVSLNTIICESVEFSRTDQFNITVSKCSVSNKNCFASNLTKLAKMKGFGERITEIEGVP